MKSMIRAASVLALTLGLAVHSVAGELTAASLQGKWLFARMLLDGTTEMKPNRQMEFLGDGTVLNYDWEGKVGSRATWELENGRIIYQDQNGRQEWKVISFDGAALHVDHKGAEMFFERH